MAREGAAGDSAFEVLAIELVAYSWPVFCAWLRTGLIYRKCAQLGRPVVREHAPTAFTADDISELANEVLGEALVRLREQASMGSGWDVDGPASLATYFLNGCALRFPGVFRRHLTRTQHQQLMTVMDHDAIPAHTITTASTEDFVLAELAVQDRLDDMPPTIRLIVLGHLDGYSHAEIAIKHGFPSARAVEGKLKRYRDGLRRQDGTRQ
jgi:DNA-directed RNA polymerase specialized sigma24 family protein